MPPKHRSPPPAVTPRFHKAPAAEPAGIGTTPHVLIVEKNRAAARSLTRCFTEHGYYVWLASNACEGYKIFWNCEIDLVICDLDLPDAKGRDLLSQLRLIRNLPAIALGDPGKDEDGQKIVGAGFTRCLASSAPPGEVVAAARQCLGNGFPGPDSSRTARLN